MDFNVQVLKQFAFDKNAINRGFSGGFFGPLFGLFVTAF
jgi:uncharacterized membrane protein